MPWPSFSELSFGYAFLREFEHAHCAGKSFPKAPDFITQSDEASKGYDVEVLTDSGPVFIQFKRSFVVRSTLAQEIASGHFSSTPLFRMYLRRKDHYRQHKALQDCQAAGNSVLYVTSQIRDDENISPYYQSRTVLAGAAAIFQPQEIRLPNRTHQHWVSFSPGRGDMRIYSDQGKSLERSTPTWNHVLRLLSERRQPEKENRAKLNEFADQVKRQADEDTRSIVERYTDPVVKASILAFLVLDAHLTFFK
jgi:hypothetical protein